MCSCGILRKLSWKFWCVLVQFTSPGKFICVLIPFLVLLENLMCSYKKIMSSLGKLEVFNWYIQASWKIWCVLEISLKKLFLEKRTDILAKSLVGCFCKNQKSNFTVTKNNSIQRGNFTKYLFLGLWPPGKSGFITSRQARLKGPQK